jgi:gentisate 1,2-dioxygenase
VSDAQNILGFYALMLARPDAALPARSPAQVFHLIEGAVDASTCGKTSVWSPADTCCAPGYEPVTLVNRRADQPSFVFIADESPLHRKLGVYEDEVMRPPGPTACSLRVTVSKGIDTTSLT